MLVLFFFIGFIFFRINRAKALSFLLFLFLVVPPAIAVPIEIFGINLVFSVVRGYFLGIIVSFIIRSKKNKFEYNTTNIFLILFIIFLFSSLSWGKFILYDLKILFSEKLLLAFLGYYIFIRSFQTLDELMYLFKILYLSIIVISFYGFIEIITGKTIEDFQLVSYFSSLDYSSDLYHFKSGGLFDDNTGTSNNTRGGFLRPSGSFWNNIIYAIALTFMTPYIITIRSRFYVKNKIFKQFMVFSSSLLTISRSAWFSILYAFMLNFKKNKFISIILITIFAFILLPFLTLDFSNRGYADGSGLAFASRFAYIIPVFNELSSLDLLRGLGVGTFNFAIDTDQKTTFISRLPADNTFAQFVFSYGLLGTFLFLTFFANIFRSLSLKFKEKSNSFQINSILTASKQVLIIQITLFFISNSLFQDVRLNFLFFSMFGAISSVLLKSK